MLKHRSRIQRRSYLLPLNLARKSSIIWVASEVAPFLYNYMTNKIKRIQPTFKIQIIYYLKLLLWFGFWLFFLYYICLLSFWIYLWDLWDAERLFDWFSYWSLFIKTVLVAMTLPFLWIPLYIIYKILKPVHDEYHKYYHG